MFYKIYPVARSSRVLFNHPTHSRKQIQRLHVWEKHLASVIDELSEVWYARDQPCNKLPYVFDREVVGCIDTFPIFVNRPGGGRQRFYYNGKYKRHVVKVSITIYRYKANKVTKYR